MTGFQKSVIEGAIFIQNRALGTSGNNEGSKMRTKLSRLALLAGISYYVYAPTVEARFLQVDPVGYEDQINLYAYVGNDPLNSIDPTGKRVEVHTTHAMGGAICGAGGCYAPIHMNIRITPDDQASIRDTNVFNRVDADGNRYATLSAGPDGVPEFSNLQSTINRVEGTTLNSFQVGIPSGYKSENQFINNLFKADASYKDNVPYTLFPDSESAGRNSNSYVSGILGAAGKDITNIGAQTGLDIPGADVPLKLPCVAPGGNCP